ncbi:hypothetical protein [Frankia sp. AgW1.1]|uniref:hypothetical protein n=1 Tax=Frankia sp. AgW1.1 TaxID=1836971 RepID=UPI0019338A5F|nr:hypothetical protein [Frankia sp. AgW1.1]MBL7487055.1 hypothetical protein [Frankia sp. AgW1.1]
MNIDNPAHLIAVARRESSEADAKIDAFQRKSDWQAEAEIRGHLSQAIEALTEVLAQFGSEDS